MVGVRDNFHVLADTPCDLVPDKAVTEFERALMVVSRRRLLSVPTQRYRDLVAMLSSSRRLSSVLMKDLDFLEGAGVC